LKANSIEPTREMRLENEKEKMKEEEREVQALLLSDGDDDTHSDEVEYVSDSEGYLLLAPDSDGA
jgi:hypothetical protein